MLSLLIVVSKVISETPTCFFLKPSFQSAYPYTSSWFHRVQHNENANLCDFACSWFFGGRHHFLARLLRWRLESFLLDVQWMLQSGSANHVDTERWASRCGLRMKMLPSSTTWIGCTGIRHLPTRAATGTTRTSPERFLFWICMERANKSPLLLCNSNGKLNLAPIFYPFSRNAPFSERNILSKGFVFKLKTEGVYILGGDKIGQWGISI
jgi:hypothetical protein